jgi:hypothetical protein
MTLLPAKSRANNLPLAKNGEKGLKAEAEA